MTQQTPASTWRAIRSPFCVSRVHTDAWSPYGPSLASLTASRASPTFITGRVGPKVSSVMQRIE